MHADNKMKVVGHDAKSQNIGKIEFAKMADQLEKVVFFGVLEGETVKGGSGDDMVDGGDIRTDKSGNAWHERPPSGRWVCKTRHQQGWVYGKMSVE
jgi:hypothetical protein